MPINKWCMGLLLTMLWSLNGFAQGPPITGGKPIMLGANSWLVKSLTEIRKTEEGTFVKLPVMVHYLPTANTLLGVHLPFVNYKFNEGASGQTLGDIELLGKYMFYRKDEMGKTFRVVLKTIQTLPTGKSLVAGYETIKYGISNELGYNISPSNDRDELRYKLGFGLPLLKPTYPVKQINLYFEYQSSWFHVVNDFMLLYAQGIQYAKGRVTMEASLQLPLIQTISEDEQRKFSLFLGSRFVF